MRTGKLLPGLPSIIGAEDAAFVVVEEAPSRYINRRWIGGIEDDVVKDVIVAKCEMSEQLPRSSAILRDEELTGTGAKQNVIRIAGIESKAADIAALGTDHPPVGGNRVTSQQANKKNTEPEPTKPSANH